ncbi:MAG: hypothetical protein DRR16_30035 [Candidatus Parabeggiatoa sp. nov. 3]|nr:MAG: hypothetical protein DRQ99_28200 [Gammaproteobacteria bacterium]RKZ76958.1 MAG: hypothetical protein DRR16_30035 [Gammaproteobacteria bacterium]
MTEKFILRLFGSAKFILRLECKIAGFWSAKFILRVFWSAKFILPGRSVLYSIRKGYKYRKGQPQGLAPTKDVFS